MAPPATLILWNKLGSAGELAASEVGQNGSWTAGVAAYAACKFNNGVYTNTANNGQISIPGTGFTPNLFTVEFWVKTDYAVTNGAISTGGYDSCQPFSWRFNATNYFMIVLWNGFPAEFYIVIGGAAVITTFNDATFTWLANSLNHFSVSYSQAANQLKVFINGTALTTKNPGTGNQANTGGTIFLLNNVNPVWNFKGNIDNIKIWNYAKTNYTDINIEGYTPNDITNFTAVQGTHDGDIDLAWTDPVAPYTGTTIRRSTAAIVTIADGAQIADCAAGTMVYADTGLTAGVTYYYKAFPYITVLGTKYYSTGVASVPGSLTPYSTPAPVVANTIWGKIGLLLGLHI